MSLPPSLLHARELVAELIVQGVRHVVLSPGSRSAPLAYAAYCAAEAGLLEVHVKIDERSGAFLALGIAKAGPGPAAIITTSGTAVANLHPAFLEAHHGQVPLVVLSADRPHELRGTGANQTTDQVGIFGTAARVSIDLAAPTQDTDPALTRAATAQAVVTARGTTTNHPGPVQLNCGFREPLAPSAQELIDLGGFFTAISPTAPIDATRDRGKKLGIFDVTKLESVATTVVIAGDGAGPEAALCAQTNGWPLIAEPSAQVRGLAHGSLILKHAGYLVEQVTQVLVFGRPTLTRQVQQLIARPAVNLVIVGDSAAPYVDPGRRASLVLPIIATPWGVQSERDQDAVTPWLDTPWLEQWQSRSDTIAKIIDAHVSQHADTTTQQVALAVSRSSPHTPVLFLGASSPIRDLDLYGRLPQGVTVLANRGLAGIDGIVSTALGIALGLGQPVRAIMGDLTFLHDVGGLLREPGAPKVDLDIVVLNDHGGAIFDGLEHGEVGNRDLFNRVFTTPQHANLSQLCAGYGITHESVLPVELTAALSHVPNGLRVIEVPLDPADRLCAAARLTTEIAEALAKRSRSKA